MFRVRPESNVGVILVDMGGRYGRQADKQRIAEWFQTHDTNVFDEDSYYAPSYNVGPQSTQPIVRLDPETGQRELTAMRWGLIPFWATGAKIAYSTVNAKAETLTTSQSFRGAFKRRRCFVPADWFYKWPKVDGEKQAHAFSLRDGSTFAFAGYGTDGRIIRPEKLWRLSPSLQRSRMSGWKSTTTGWPSYWSRKTTNVG